MSDQQGLNAQEAARTARELANRREPVAFYYEVMKDEPAGMLIPAARSDAH